MKKVKKINMKDVIKKLLMEEEFQNESYFFESFEKIMDEKLLVALLQTIKLQKYTFLQTDTSLLILATTKPELEQLNTEAFQNKTMIDLTKIKEQCYFRIDQFEKTIYVFTDQIFTHIVPNKDIKILSYSLSNDPFAKTNFMLKNTECNFKIIKDSKKYNFETLKYRDNLIFSYFESYARAQGLQ